MQNIDLKDVHFRTLTLGVVAIHTGTKHS
jgi:hypothetical protein